MVLIYLYIYIFYYYFSKVYSIILCQLILTIGILILATYHDPFKEYLERHIFSFKIIAIITTCGTIFPLACYEYLRRIFPINVILFFLFTIGQSFFLATFVSHFYPEHTLFALYLTAFICFILSIFAIQTKIDFTVTSGILSIGLMVFFYMFIIYLFFPGNLLKHIVLVTGVIIFTIHLLYDTQLMIGGKHRYSISPDEYLIAAILIFVDIIFIFVIILSIIGGYINYK